MHLPNGATAPPAGVQNHEKDLPGSHREVTPGDHDLPSFLIIGPPRTGTTWLHEVLSPHARLPEPTKEIRFFDRHFDRGLAWYRKHFPQGSDARPPGEVAPTYFASPEARIRIARTMPDARVIIIFRHPAQRLVSMYRMKRAYGLIGWGLEEALERDPELLGSSRYATHLREWQSLFGPKQIWVGFFHDLSADPQAFIDRVGAHAGIAPFRLEPSQLEQVYSAAQMTAPRSFLATRAAMSMADWCKARRFDNVVAGVRNSSLMKLFVGGGAPLPEIPPRTLTRITELLQPEIEALEEMLGRDLTAWKLPAAS